MKWFVYSDKVKEKSHTKEALEKQINTKNVIIHLMYLNKKKAAMNYYIISMEKKM